MWKLKIREKLGSVTSVGVLVKSIEVYKDFKYPGPVPQVLNFKKKRYLKVISHYTVLWSMNTRSSVLTEWALETFGVSRNIPITFGGLWISPSMSNRRCASALSSELTSRIFSGCFYSYHTDQCYLFKFYLSFSLQKPRKLMTLQKNVRWKFKKC